MAPGGEVIVVMCTCIIVTADESQLPPSFVLPACMTGLVCIRCTRTCILSFPWTRGEAADPDAHSDTL